MFQRKIRVFILMVGFFCLLPQPGQGVVPLPQSEDDDKAQRQIYLNQVEAKIAKIAHKYPQLRHWGNEVADERSVWRGEAQGRLRSETEIFYGSSLKSTTSSNYKDWFGKNGCEISLHLVKKELAMVIQPGAAIKSGALGRLCNHIVVATVITEHPENQQLEHELWSILSEIENPCPSSEVYSNGLLIINKPNPKKSKAQNRTTHITVAKPD